MHFHTVYNSKVIIDWDLLKELEQKSSKDELGLPFSYLEFLDTIQNSLSIKLVVLTVYLRTPYKLLTKEIGVLCSLCVDNISMTK